MKICATCGARFVSARWECPSCHTAPKVINGYPAFSPEMAAESEGFETGYFGELFALEETNFWFRSRNRLILWALQQYFPNAGSFFEIGCGTGFVLSGIERAFPHLALYGSEIFSAGLAYAARRLNRAELFQMDARQIPFENEFDVIGAFDVLEHVKDDGVVLQQMHQALCTGGGLLITVPQHPLLWSHLDEYACHVRRYTSKELRRKVVQAGFELERITSFVSLLLPFMAASRVRTRWGKNDPLAGLKLGNLTNSLMEKVLDMERALIRKGISLPLGGSLLLIGRKK